MTELRRLCLAVSVLLSLACFAEPGTAENGAGDVEITPPAFLERKAPVYPKAQQRLGSAGIVELSVMVNEQGEPFDIIVLRSSHPHFEKSASAALEKYVFAPAQQHGQAVTARKKVWITYEIEGQLNTLSKRVYDWIGKNGGLFAGDGLDEQRAAKALTRVKRVARTRCDHAWASLFASQYALSFKPPKQKVEALRTALMFDLDELAEDSRCYTDDHKTALADALLRELIDGQEYSQALRFHGLLQTYGLPETASKFDVELVQLKADMPSLEIVDIDDASEQPESLMLELTAQEFKLEPIEVAERAQRLGLRCDNGFKVLSSNKEHRYPVPASLQGCSLLIDFANKN